MILNITMILMNLAISMIKTMIIKILVMITIMIDHLCGNSVLGTFPCALPSTAAKVLPSYNHNQNYHHHHLQNVCPFMIVIAYIIQCAGIRLQLRGSCGLSSSSQTSISPSFFKILRT